MEELRKLEHVQAILNLLQSKDIVSFPTHNNNNNDSYRFVANFLQFLLQPCGDLNIDNKCTLISQIVPNLSSSILEKASLILNPKIPVLTPSFDDVAVIGLDSMKRANSTLEDFCRSYFMFHGIDVNSPELVFKYLPMLSFAESYIYQMDGLNEKIVNMQSRGVAVMEGQYKKGSNDSLTGFFMDVLRTDPFRPLAVQLEKHGLLTERIKEEFRQGEEYWALERKLCSALRNGQEISVDDVMRAIHLKSFDYRVMNLLLYQLRGEKVNDLHMEFLSTSEFLVEVSDDLFDYEDDVLENSFNILRLFVGIYGPSAAPSMLAKIITEAEEKYDILLKTLDPQLSLNYQRRCEQATKEGGKTCGHPLGTWTIPLVIVDEKSYRSNWFDSSQLH